MLKNLRFGPSARIFCAKNRMMIPGFWLRISSNPPIIPTLGQLLTYAACLEAGTLIWIAIRFTEEHRGALDWLNEATGDDINLFGLEIELWQIDDSNLAPKFNIVSQPNNWKKQTRGARDEAGLTKTQSRQLKFWRSLGEQLKSTSSNIHPYKPSAQNHLSFRFGYQKYKLWVSTHNTKHDLGAGFSVTRGAERLARYKLIQNFQEQIDNELEIAPFSGEPWGFHLSGPKYDPSDE